MSLKPALGILLLALAAFTLAPVPAMAAGCTATLNCNNLCTASRVCWNGCEIGCTFFNTTASCSGTTSCTVGTSSVTCDGNTVSCPTGPQCSSTNSSVRCGTLVRYCPSTCPR
jgi:hypothetical protein